MSSNGGFFIPDGDDEDRYRRPVQKRSYGTRRSPNYVGIVDFTEDDDEEEEPIQYCPHCSEFKYQSQLKEMRLKRGQPVPEDYDKWLECYTCSTRYGKHEIEKQKQLQVSDLKRHVTENAFEAGQTIIDSVPKRTRKTMAKQAKKRNRPTHKDPEIQRELDQHGSENVHIIEDSDP